MIYERKVDHELGDALQRLTTSSTNLDEVQAAVVRDALRDYRRAAALTKELAQRKAELESRGYQAWFVPTCGYVPMQISLLALPHPPKTRAEARASNDFSKFAPVLSQWGMCFGSSSSIKSSTNPRTVAHTREVCARIDPDKDPYDVALDTYEKGMTSARLDKIFDQVCVIVHGHVPTFSTIPKKASWHRRAYARPRRS